MGAYENCEWMDKLNKGKAGTRMYGSFPSGYAPYTGCWAALKS